MPTLVDANGNYAPPIPLPFPNVIDFGGSIGGGTPGTSQLYQGRAPAAPDDTSKAALSYPDGGGPAQEWDVNSQTWV
jgi:hypothetical protein